MNEGESYPQHSFFVFDLPYWILTPAQEELDNLLVVNAPSVSHVAFAAVWEEPTLWHLGMAAWTAVAWAAQHKTTVQKVSIAQLQKALKKQGVMVHGPRKCSSWKDANPLLV